MHSIEVTGFSKLYESSQVFESEIKNFSQKCHKNKQLKEFGVKFFKMINFPIRYLVTVQVGIKFEIKDDTKGVSDTGLAAIFETNLSEEQRMELRHLPFNFEKFSEQNFFECKNSLSENKYQDFWRTVVQYDSVKKMLNGYSKLTENEDGVFYRVTKSQYSQEKNSIIIGFRIFTDRLESLKFTIGEVSLI